MLQTFLPFPNIYPSVWVLTDDQLCKQRVDAKKILDTLENKNKTYRHHPAVKMWKGHKLLLKGYLAGCIDEWMKRGYSNNMEYPSNVSYSQFKLPLWWGGRIHNSHRARLAYDNPEHYRHTSVGKSIHPAFLQRQRPKLFWPVKHNGQLR